jgi:hypothetical protein
MKTLPTEFRRQLERTVIEARDVAEAGARVALEALAVQHHEPYGHMDAEQRTLRRRLRAHARQLGDRPDPRSGGHGIDHLVHECAYEHWHGMLFARFLAENQLLIEPETGVAITLDECEELAKDEAVDKWGLATRFAHRMLPQVFRPDHPVFAVQLAREHRLKLESLVEGLPAEVFAATDSLGWVYQFWQTKKKGEVNASGKKIGADELPSVTQLFTEPYMVRFLLDNSLGAWWVSRHPDKTCPVDLPYLRRTEKGVPAAGAFEGWPDDLAALRLLDPCCGSGHFLVAAFLMLVPMRMQLQGLSAADAVDAVLRENIHGLELDQRCVAIAAFALALEAWRYPNTGRFRHLPKLNLAWCGQPIVGKREQWLALASGDSRLEAGMATLYDEFRDAPILGSLIDPTRSVSNDMLTATFEELEPLLETALLEHSGDEERDEAVIAALGLAETARILAGQYHAILTNVPYLGREKHAPRLRSFCEQKFPRSKHDLATVFVERLLRLCAPGGELLLVLPQYWLFLARYRDLRRHLLENQTWHLLATLGPGAFETISGEVVNTCLIAMQGSANNAEHDAFHWLDASKAKGSSRKAELLTSVDTVLLAQAGQLKNPDVVIGYVSGGVQDLLDSVAYAYQGLATSDNAQFVFNFWEVPKVANGWELFQFAPECTEQVSGCSHILLWEGGEGKYADHALALKEEGRLGGWKSGHDAWGKRGIAINRMGELPASLYFGTKFDCNVAVLIPRDERDIPPIWAYCSSADYSANVRKLNSKLSVTNATLAKVPYDSSRWATAAAGQAAADLYRVTTTDPTQWLFHGLPKHTSSPLQVAVIRMLGYRWPAELDPDMGLSDQARGWVARARTLHSLADDDGIVCIPSVRGERPAHERLLHLLEASWGDEWRDDIRATLLAEAGASSIDDWLRNQFFEEHCNLFQQRPFVWHLWDGRKHDGFHALVNYHNLAEGNGKGRRLLESLAYSYLGDWVARQHDGVKRGEGGAEDRLASALELQKQLVAILEGKPPFDLFVRWKPIEEQPVGWNPDLNDGVRINIRPFMAQDIPGGKKNAGILRDKPNIHWRKDRGKEAMREEAEFPWFWHDGKFTGDRVNDIHVPSESRKKTNG